MLWPFIEIYRMLARDVHTPFEQPHTFQTIDRLGQHFRFVAHEEFQLCTLSLFIWFFLGERVHPGKVRYWKKIITEHTRYERAFQLLQRVDERLLDILPFLRRYCWNTVIELVK